MINRKQRQWLKDNKFSNLDCSYHKSWNFINGSFILLSIFKRTLEAQIMGRGDLQPINYDEAIKLKDEWEELKKEK